MWWARRDWIEGLVDLQVATSFGGPSPVAAELVCRVLADGAYRKHMAALRPRLAKRRREVAGRLEGLGVRPFIQPRGGFLLWCRLPGGRDGALVAKRALGEGVVLAPGNVFSVSQTATDFMRFNVAQMGGDSFSALGRALG